MKDRDKILNDIERHLAESGDLMVSLKHLLFILQDHGYDGEADELKELIKKDKRFHIEEPSKSSVTLHGWAPHFNESMVMLKAKQPSLDDIFAEIHKNLEDLSGTLSRAYLSSPESSEGGDQLLAMMHEVESLKYDTNRLLNKAKNRKVYDKKTGQPD